MRVITAPDPIDAPGIKWGILAPGHIANRFVTEVHRYTLSRIAAVGSRDFARAQQFATEHGIERAYGSYAELVDDPTIDAIYVANPHSEHHAAALLALESGKPVLVEKAFTINAAQAEDVFTLAKRQGLFAMEAMWSRFLPHYPTVKALIDDGDLGEVVGVTANHSQPLNFNPEGRLLNPALAGGALLDLGIYPMSFFHYLLGSPTTVHAEGVLTETGVDQREAITLGFAAGAYGLSYCDLSAAGTNPAEIIGTVGRIDIPGWFYQPQNIVFTPLNGEPITLRTKVEGGFQYEAAEAARCIRDGRVESGVISWADTVAVLRTTDAIRAQLGVVYPQER
ncbi:MAG: Gfo/Idh/MocA family oxidoreductase [Propionibacteriaceae bacterium]|jgi:predicted dehydrogenase|nr:Gfo/Idh/MocA family oxidoreductase [Propionibacteriaceae bacterium]